MGLIGRAQRYLPGMRALEERVAVLESDLEEVRRHNLRVAELVDVVQELLVPMAQRDQEAVDRVVEKFNQGL